MPEPVVSLMRGEEELLRKVPLGEALERLREEVEETGADDVFTDDFSFRVWPERGDA